MPDLPYTVTLLRVATGEPSPAQLVELTTQLAKLKMKQAWWTGLGTDKERRQREGDHHWNWVHAIGQYRNDIDAECVAVQTPDGDVQAAMIIRYDALSATVERAPAVEIERLATAPRNRPWLVGTPAYSGAGVALVRWAAYRSYQTGFGGRVVLGSLPDPRTTEFYEKRGFRKTGHEKDDTIIMELEPERAVALILEDTGLV